MSTTRPPVVLEACRESRFEGFKFYAKIFGTNTAPGNIYFAASFDILYIPRCGNMGYGDLRDFAQYVIGTAEHIRSLAIDHAAPEVRRHGGRQTPVSLRKLHQLTASPSPGRTRRWNKEQGGAVNAWHCGYRHEVDEDAHESLKVRLVADMCRAVPERRQQNQRSDGDLLLFRRQRLSGTTCTCST